ncbi:PEP-CTERM sorting domain-containing protein [Accumulibacter sp.]|uniref:PEP-CTERM sorting domain-containing protein n=1 Tax=Accumulibacter sp. TaxID=2053492 RepID=UPI00262560C2|nr:PEP-CTERM sorting domain-containing protein [Accumulibacter sp.]
MSLGRLAGKAMRLVLFDWSNWLDWLGRSWVLPCVHGNNFEWLGPQAVPSRGVAMIAYLHCVSAHRQVQASIRSHRQARLRWHPRTVLAELFLLGFLVSVPFAARAVTYTVGFAAANQNPWGGGTSSPVNLNEFFGFPWDETGNAGKVYCTGVGDFKVCGGAELSGHTDGKLGLNYGLNMSTGSLAVQYPVQVNLATPTQSVLSGDPFTIGSSFTPLADGFKFLSESGPKFSAPASLKTTGPHFSTYLDLVANIVASVSGETCVAACISGGGQILDEKHTYEVFSINRNNSGQLKLLGQSQGYGVNVTAGPVTATVLPPNLNSDSQVKGGLAGFKLMSGVRDDLGMLALDVDKLVTDLLGFPPLSGTIGPISYNALSVNAGLGLDIEQHFSFEPKLTTMLEFSSAVRVQGLDGSLGPATTSVEFLAGQSITLRSASAATSVGVFPTFSLGGTVRNTTDLILTGDVWLEALGASILGKDLGPIVKKNTSADLHTFNVFDKAFDLHFSTAAGQVFKLDFDHLLPFSEQQPNEILDICLLVAGGCSNTGFVMKPQLFFPPDGPPGPPDPVQMFAYDVFHVDDIARCTAETLLTRTCDDTMARLFGQTSRRVLGEDNDAEFFFFDEKSLVTPMLLAVGDESLATATDRLTSLGYEPGYRPFVVPPAPTVPEPGTILLLLIAMAAWIVGPRPKMVL